MLSLEFGALLCLLFIYPDTGEYFIPVWMRPPSEWEWYNKWKENKAQAGFDEDEPFYNIVLI